MSDGTRRGIVPHGNYCVRIVFQEADKTLNMDMELEDTEGGVRIISTRTWDTPLDYNIFTDVVVGWCTNNVEKSPEEFARRILDVLVQLNSQEPYFLVFA